MTKTTLDRKKTTSQNTSKTKKTLSVKSTNGSSTLPHPVPPSNTKKPPSVKPVEPSLSTELVLSKKDFRESPAVEKFYKTIYEYKLREEAYKASIEIYLNLKT